MNIKLPEYGAVRERRKFFWIPSRVDNTIYWLERRTVREEWWRRGDGWPTYPFCNHAQWMVMKMLD